MPHEIIILDLIGTFAFAMYGSYFALKKDFDIFGIFLSAFLTAVGGGTLREVILGHIPFYLYDMRYIAGILLAVIFTIVIYKRFHKIQTFALLLDSVGLVTFAFIGASKASEIGLGLFAVIFFATITAVGGGVIRDLVLNEIPKIAYSDFYASVAILLGLLYGVAGDNMQNFFWANTLIGFCLVIRVLAITNKIHLWKPNTEPVE